MNREETTAWISKGRAVLGIELGSTRIKAVLIGEDREPIAQGEYAWENQFVNGVWTYELSSVWQGLQKCYQNLSKDVEEKYGVKLSRLAAMGVSAMMHGYLAFGRNGELLTPFRTWRNTMTERAAAELTELFQYNIPQRWSIAHLYQAILNGEEHAARIRFLTTLSGYVHWCLTGQKVLGIGDAAGMMPIDPKTKDYSQKMLTQFDVLIADRGYPWRTKELLPRVLLAGQEAGRLTETGVRLLDVTGRLEAGIPMCPPEGDAGTGMTATNSVAGHTGNVSAGTSAFGMVVLEEELSFVYRELDLVSTPDGKPVAMAHCNNCTSDLNAWIQIFAEFANLMGMNVTKEELYGRLYRKALEGDESCGDLMACNYLSGEHVTGLEQGRPLFVRKPDSRFDLANFMKVHLYTSLAVLKTGMDILLKKERIPVRYILGHGGFFKTKDVGQRMLAAALDTPVSVMETAGEGGAWGIALLADYLVRGANKQTLEQFLDGEVFVKAKETYIWPKEREVEAFERFMERYREGLKIERAAVDHLC